MEIESLFPKGSLSNSWVVRECLVKYNSIFITQIIEYKAQKTFLAGGEVKMRKHCEEQFEIDQKFLLIFADMSGVT